VSAGDDYASAIKAAAETASRRLMDKGVSLATVESCTGGWVAQSMTAIAGSSDFFDRGWATYSNEAKMQCVGVPAGVAKSAAGVAVSITGVAGPTGGSPEKPVGTVCFGWASRDGSVHTERMQFDGDRESVRAQSVVHALDGIAHVLP